MNYFLSVIIPVYNGEKYIEQAILSVLNQPSKNIEIICINDGSTDNSLKIINNLSKFEERIVVLDQKNSGVASARNKGINIANGKYITFLDQDDIYCNNAVSNDLINSIVNQYPDIISFAYYNSNQNITRLKLNERKSKVILNCDNIAGENYRHHSSYFYNKEFIVSKGIIFDNYRNEDERFRMQAIYQCDKIMYFSQPIFIYRNNRFSVTHDKNRNQIFIFLSCIQGYELLLSSTNNKQIIEYAEGSILHLCLELFQSQTIHIYKKIDIYINKYKIIDLLNKRHWLSNYDIESWKLFFENRKGFILKYTIYNFIVKIFRYISRLKIIKYIYEMKKYPIKNMEKYL